MKENREYEKKQNQILWEEQFSKKFTDNVLKDGYGNDLITDQAEPIMKFIKKQIASAVEAREREIQEYARKMRKDVDEGTYCNKQDGEWKNGYDCAMYDILLIINPSKE